MNKLYKMPGVRANVTPYAVTLYKLTNYRHGYAYTARSFGRGSAAARRILPYVTFTDDSKRMFVFPWWSRASAKQRQANRNMLLGIHRALYTARLWGRTINSKQ